MTTKPKPTRKKAPRPPAEPAITPEQHAAFLQAVLLENTVSEITMMRERLKIGDCPASITAGERSAAVVDLDRALAQLNNLQPHYWPVHP